VTSTVPPPDPDLWPEADPASAGLDPAGIVEAVAIARRETDWPRDLKKHLEDGFFDPPPWNALLGPVQARGGPNGLILRGGRVVARWGDTRQVDMTFSVAKSYLSLLAGIAVADGLIADLDEPVARTVDDGGFEPPHNDAITWRHLLQQTSEWEGSMWGKPDQIDRFRLVALEGKGADKGKARELQTPGTFWEYNDVRVNRTSLALLRRLRRPLPEVFAERIMRPIGASSGWRWEGYGNSFVEIDGKRMQSVPGGAHWGGGVFIHAEDQARVALLASRDGLWGGRRLLPEGWMAESTAPCDHNPLYGFMWWLNTGRGRFPSASPESFFALGSGGNICWIDPTTDIIAVMRWIRAEAVDPFMRAVAQSVR
jgi:CubicO group peptidase (beta-lactamase class C family)